MRDAVASRCFPGAVLLVSEQGRILLHRAYGMADIFNGEAMTCDTVFDLASLTKPLATTLAVMQLVQQGVVSLDRPCYAYCPGFQEGGKEKITLRHLLSHCSGLPAWKPYYLRFSGIDPKARNDLLRRVIFAEPLSAAPGERTEYSDLGFLMLQWVVEYITGKALDNYLSATLFGPLGLTSLFFVRHDQPQLHSRYRYAATEVHDDNAHWIGGVAGHAGLFGTAGAVWNLLQGLLATDTGWEQHLIFERIWVQRFFERQIGSTRTLGFDTPSQTASSAGHLFSDESIGHLGYTGTSFWMDRKRGVVIILLTNRVHPSRYDTRIKTFRPRLHDAVMRALIDGNEFGSTGGYE